MPVSKCLFADFGFSDVDTAPILLGEKAFKRLFYQEQKRAERSGLPLLVVVMDLSVIVDVSERKNIAKIFLEHLTSLTRTSDACGWFRESEVLGCVFVDIADHDLELAIQSIEFRIRGCMKMWLTASVYQMLHLSIRVFPDDIAITSERLRID